MGDEEGAAKPLGAALSSFTDPVLLQRHADTYARLSRGSGSHGDSGRGSEQGYNYFDVLYRTDALGSGYLAEAAKLWTAIKAAFFAKLAAGELVAWGRPDSPVAPKQEVPAAAWKVLGRPDWKSGIVAGPGVTLYDVQVGRRLETAPTTQSLTQPPRPEPLHGLAGEPSDGPPELPPALAPKLSDLSAWWTLNQAIVWIALRDTAAVHNAGPPHHGRDARGVMRWHVTYAVAKLNGERVGPSPSEADNQLLNAARRGVIRSRGVQDSSDKPREMDSADWAAVRIAEDHRDLGAKWLVAEGGWATFWRGVLVARDDVAREWPPFGEVPQTLPCNEPVSTPPLAAVISNLAPVPAASASPKRNRGGRPEREDWISFDQEMMRRLALDGGNLTLRAFKRAMKDWAAQNMDPVPDDRTIERRIDARAPSDVFVQD